MSSGTNRERLEQNNAKIEELIELVKTKGAGNGGSAEWQPNPTWWDIETILAEDTRDYPVKTIYLLSDASSQLIINKGVAYATSDGAFYESRYTVTHTWDKSKDKPCLIDGVEAYKTRYVIVYNNGNEVNLYGDITVLYMVSQGGDKVSYSGGERYALQAIKLNEINNSSSNTRRMFSELYSLDYISVPLIKCGVDCGQMFSSCYSLKSVPQLDTSNGTNFNSMFSSCYSLETTPQLDTSNGSDFNGMFSSCYSLKSIPQLDTGNGTNFSSMFNGCELLEEVPILDTRNGTSFGSMFYYCKQLKTIPPLDLLNATSSSALSSMFYYCENLTNLTLKNIRTKLEIGSGWTWGDNLTNVSVINTFQELWDLTGSSSQTLKLSTPSYTIAEETYVKLIDITDEMRANDQYIDNKMPCVVCESTDDGAMTLLEYGISKNWQISK